MSEIPARGNWTCWRGGVSANGTTPSAHKLSQLFMDNSLLIERLACLSDEPIYERQAFP